MNRLYETIKKIKGVEYRYLGLGRILKFIGPKNEPDQVHERNVMGLLEILDRSEYKDLQLYEEDRQKLTKLLSEARQKEYLGKRTAELQTRLRELISEIQEEGIASLQKKSYDEYLRLKKVLAQYRKNQYRRNRLIRDISEKTTIPSDNVAKIIETIEELAGK